MHRPQAYARVSPSRPRARAPTRPPTRPLDSNNAYDAPSRLQARATQYADPAGLFTDRWRFLKTQRDQEDF